MKIRTPFGLVGLILLLAFSPKRFALAATGQSVSTNRNERTEPQQRRGRFGEPERGVYKARINPHWFQNNTRFWYRNDLQNGSKQFVLVDAENGTRQPAFDHQKLAAALAKATGEQYQSDHLP